MQVVLEPLRDTPRIRVVTMHRGSGGRQTEGEPRAEVWREGDQRDLEAAVEGREGFDIARRSAGDVTRG